MKDRESDLIGFLVISAALAIIFASAIYEVAKYFFLGPASKDA